MKFDAAETEKAIGQQTRALCAAKRVCVQIGFSRGARSERRRRVSARGARAARRELDRVRSLCVACRNASATRTCLALREEEEAQQRARCEFPSRALDFPDPHTLGTLGSGARLCERVGGLRRSMRASRGVSGRFPGHGGRGREPRAAPLGFRIESCAREMRARDRVYERALSAPRSSLGCFEKGRSV